MSYSTVNLDLNQEIWDRFFYVAPLILIGTRSENGSYNLAPKHMAMPLGWSKYFGFICTPKHLTYKNIYRERTFTVSFPRPDQIVSISLAASPRCEDNSKPSLAVLPTFPASKIDGVFLKNAYLFLECQLDRIVDGFDENSLIAGKIIAARVQESVLRQEDRDDSDLLLESPLLAYLSPGRYAEIDRSYSFPFHQGFKR